MAVCRPSAVQHRATAGVLDCACAQHGAIPLRAAFSAIAITTVVPLYGRVGRSQWPREAVRCRGNSYYNSTYQERVTCHAPVRACAPAVCMR